MQWCTETIPEESYFTTDGVNDMFEPRLFDWDAVSQHCFEAWGVRPRFEWMRANYGNVFDWATGGVTNIVGGGGACASESARTCALAANRATSDRPQLAVQVFSNGLYDPWSSGGVKANLSDALPAVIIDVGAHHIDTFFSNALDPASVTAARAFEVAKIKEWISEFYAARAEL